MTRTQKQRVWSPLVYGLCTLGILGVPIVQAAETGAAPNDVGGGLIFTALAAIGGALCGAILTLWRRVIHLENQLRVADARTLHEAKDGGKFLADIVDEVHAKSEALAAQFQAMHQENQSARAEAMTLLREVKHVVDCCRRAREERREGRPIEDAAG